MTPLIGSQKLSTQLTEDERKLVEEMHMTLCTTGSKGTYLKRFIELYYDDWKRSIQDVIKKLGCTDFQEMIAQKCTSYMRLEENDGRLCVVPLKLSRDHAEILKDVDQLLAKQDKQNRRRMQDRRQVPSSSMPRERLDRPKSSNSHKQVHFDVLPNEVESERATSFYPERLVKFVIDVDKHKPTHHFKSIEARYTRTAEVAYMYLIQMDADIEKTIVDLAHYIPWKLELDDLGDPLNGLTTLLLTYFFDCFKFVYDEKANNFFIQAIPGAKPESKAPLIKQMLQLLHKSGDN